MNWRWLMMDYFDAELQLPRSERRDIHRASHKHLGRARVPFVKVLLALFVLIAPVVGMSLILGPLTVNAPRARVIAVVLWFVLGGYVLLAYGLRGIAGPACWNVLRERGHDVCSHCGYWLRDLDETSTRCPECGAKREPMPEQKE